MGVTPRVLRGADAVACAATTLLPFALLHARALADIIVCGIGALFLLRCALLGEWGWTRLAWVRVAAALWLWLLLSTCIEGPPHAIAQAAVTLRLLLFVAACQGWALRDARARRLLALSTAAAALWIAVECWQQLLLGANLFGARRWMDGALTGPFFKPHAGASYLAVLFPAVLPPALRLLRRRDAAGRLGALLLLAAAAATMVLIGQRMPTLLMVLGLVFAALLLPSLRLPVLAALLLGAAVVAATPVVSPPTYQKLVLHFLAQMQHFWVSTYGQIYLRALAMLHASPVFGVGVDGFRDDCLDPQFLHGLPWLGVTRRAAQPGRRLQPASAQLLAGDGDLRRLAGAAGFCGAGGAVARAPAARPRPRGRADAGGAAGDAGDPALAGRLDQQPVRGRCRRVAVPRRRLGTGRGGVTPAGGRARVARRAGCPPARSRRHARARCRARWSGRGRCRRPARARTA